MIRGHGGKARYMANSSYHANLSAMIGGTNHFTVFGIALKPAPAFKDIKGHWAKDDILFVASRKLLSRTGKGQFSPDAGMSRGMFVTALGRLAGIAAAQGLVKNDPGHWLYYKGGTALTGWQTIGKLRYYFNGDGVMAVNTKIDGYEIGSDGARK